MRSVPTVETGDTSQKVGDMTRRGHLLDTAKVKGMLKSWTEPRVWSWG